MCCRTFVAVVLEYVDLGWQCMEFNGPLPAIWRNPTGDIFFGIHASFTSKYALCVRDNTHTHTNNIHSWIDPDCWVCFVSFECCCCRSLYLSRDACEQHICTFVRVVSCLWRLITCLTQHFSLIFFIIYIFHPFSIETQCIRVKHRKQGRLSLCVAFMNCRFHKKNNILWENERKQRHTVHSHIRCPLLWCGRVHSMVQVEPWPCEQMSNCFTSVLISFV